MVRRPRVVTRRQFVTFFAAMLVASMTILTSCQSSPTTVAPPTTPRVTAVQAEPVVRVRVMNGVSSATLAGPSLRLATPGTPGQLFASPVRITRQGALFIITDARNQSVQSNVATLEVTADGSGVVLNGNAYPGVMVLQAIGSTFDAVNHVPIEQYLPGVLERELYSSWPAEAFVAQVIAARSYAIAQLGSTSQRHYDLESTVASQVYGGRASNPKAIDAAAQTRGQVLTWKGRVLRAYFSASSGGVSQDAQAAFPDRTADSFVAPLRGHAHGWGRSSPNYQWGPIRRDVRELSTRIAAWGRANRHAIANLGTLTRIDVVQRGSSGRPATFLVSDARGQQFRLTAEQFRFACNADASGLPKLDAAQQLKSSFVELRVEGGSVTFTGRGHGHGVGLDQWAARDMAAAGYAGRQIVTFFYPGAQLQRLY